MNQGKVDVVKQEMARVNTDILVINELKWPKEDARYFLPMGIETNLKIACNFRELRHILKQRLDKHAQWEVREVAKEMLAICQEKWPWLVEDLED